MKIKILFVTTLLLSFLSCACQNSKHSAVTSDSNDVTEIKIVSHYFNQVPPKNGSLVEQAIEKATHTKLDIRWIPSSNYDDKLNVMLESLDLPDLLLIRDPFNPVFQKAVRDGVFWDLSPYIKKYPNLISKIDQNAWEYTEINGGNYGVPRPRPSEGEPFFIIRKDWLRNLGLNVPSNDVELYQVMKAFTKEDPDQNGKDDTFAFAGQVNPSDMGTLSNFEGIFTGANGSWKLVGGKIIYTALIPEERQALVFLAKAYKDGLFPADFASLQQPQVKELFKAGKAGIISEKSGAMQEYYNQLKKVQPDFQFSDLLPLEQVNNYNPRGVGYSGINAIPKSVSKEKMKKILAVLNHWMDQNVFILQKQGINGIHHTFKNGKVVINSKKMVEDSVSDFNQIVYVSDPYASTLKSTFPQEVQQIYKKVQDERAKKSVADVSTGLNTDSNTHYLQDLTDQIVDLKTKIILGEKPINAWDDYIPKLVNDEGLKKVTAEINAAYQQRLH